MRTILLALSIMMAAQPAFAFEGTYSDRSIPGKAVLTIKKTGSKGYAVSNKVTWKNGCSGRFSGVGRVSGDQLVAEEKIDGEACTLTIAKVAGGLSVEESGCIFQHGASCEFAGTYSLAK